MTEYGLLGPLQVVREGRSLPLGGPRQQAVLARLLLAGGRVVPAGLLADDVWGGCPPPTAGKTLQKYVSELRKVLGAELVTVGDGYALHAGSDVERFEQLVAAGCTDRALSLWRGEPLGALPDVPFVTAERARLEELRLVAEERSAEAAVRGARDAEVVARLTGLADEHPERERLCGLLMRALYRSGRQVEALEVFRRHRSRLVDELGIAPAEELVALEQAILRHDPVLAPQMPGNVRLPVSTFVGRDDELRRTLAALRGPGPVTLTGPGGVGKTRLALEAAVAAAAEHPGGTWLVDLSGLRDPGLVVHQVGLTLAIGDPADGDEEAAVVAALASRDPLLLVLDNCEHLVARCAAFVDRLVRASPHTRVLATSRHPLVVDGEHLLVVAPLPAPDAARLLEDRVRRAGVDDDEVAALPVADICRALDGLPLALELAAGQLRALGPAGLAAGLDARLQFANRRFDAPDRQRTLRDMVAWSHALLPGDTQRVFTRLGVFAATVTAEGAAAVCAPEPVAGHLVTLVEHCLVVRNPGSPTRFRVLDTLRLFALEQLRAAGSEDDARRAHATYHLDLLTRLGPRLYGPDEEETIAAIEAEEPNVHAALEWAAEHDPALAVRLAVAAWPYWGVRWRERFAIAYLTRLLDCHGAGLSASDRAWALTVMADMAANPGEARLALGPAEEAAAIFRAVGDERGLCAALMAQASACRDEGSLGPAARALAETRELAERLRDPVLAAKTVNVAWAIEARRGRSAEAEALGREEIARWAALGSRRERATALRHVAVTLQGRGDLDGATELCREALAVWEEVGEAPAIAHAQTTLADISRERGDLDGAERLYRGALVALRAVGDRRCTASTYKNLAVLASARGEHDRAGALFRDAIRLRCDLGDHAGLAECFTGLADDLAAVGRFGEAAVLLAAGEERRRASGTAASPEEVRAVQRIERRRGPAVVPEPRPTLENVLGLEIY